MNETIKKELHWLIASSADPTKVSLTIKGLAVAVPSIVMFLTLIGHPVAPDALTSLFDAIGTAVTAILTAVSAVMTVYGLFRKVYYAITQKS